MSSKAIQVAEFQALYFRAYSVFSQEDNDRSLLELFANFAYGGTSAASAATSTQTEEKAQDGAEDDASAAGASESATGSSEADAQAVDAAAAGESDSKEAIGSETSSPAKKTPGGNSSIVFGGGQVASPKSSTRVTNAPGGKSSITFGEEQVSSRPSTRVTNAPGGKSSIVFGDDGDEPERPVSRRRPPGGVSQLQLGSEYLARDNTRKKKKEEVKYRERAPMKTPREMAAATQSSQIFDKGSPIVARPNPVATGKELLRFIQKFGKTKTAFLEFVGDRTGKLITIASFKEAAKKNAVNVTDEYVQKLFDNYDKKNTGTLNYSSFVRMINAITDAVNGKQ